MLEARRAVGSFVGKSRSFQSPSERPTEESPGFQFCYSPKHVAPRYYLSSAIRPRSHTHFSLSFHFFSLGSEFAVTLDFFHS